MKARKTNAKAFKLKIKFNLGVLKNFKKLLTKTFARK